MERRYDAHIAAYAYGPFGPISRTILNADAQHCVHYLLSDGRGNTIAVADDDDNFLYQGFDAFGVPLERAVISSCEMPECPNCKRARRASGELGYHGHEGYRTRHYDANREADLPNAQRQDLTTPHPDYDSGHSEGYESPSTGFIQVGARDYDPYIGRFLEPDPEQTGPELQWGQNNRWAYCANDPANFSDPSGRSIEDEVTWALRFKFGDKIGRLFGRLMSWAGAALIVLGFAKDLLDPFIGGCTGLWDKIDSLLAWLVLLSFIGAIFFAPLAGVFVGLAAIYLFSSVFHAGYDLVSAVFSALASAEPIGNGDDVGLLQTRRVAVRATALDMRTAKRRAVWPQSNCRNRWMPSATEGPRKSNDECSNAYA